MKGILGFVLTTLGIYLALGMFGIGVNDALRVFEHGWLASAVVAIMLAVGIALQYLNATRNRI